MTGTSANTRPSIRSLQPSTVPLRRRGRAPETAVAQPRRTVGERPVKAGRRNGVGRAGAELKGHRSQNELLCWSVT